MVRINLNLFPRGGRYFKESDGTVHRADSWPGVVARVKEYRKRNRMEPGDPENEVHAQACQRNPNLCHTPPSKEERIRSHKRGSLKGRVLAWLSKFSSRKDQLEFVSELEAKARADICAKCPLNADIADGCSSCKAAIKEYRADILGRRKQDQRITACLELGEDTVVSTWLAEPTEENGNLPQECWRKKTL